MNMGYVKKIHYFADFRRKLTRICNEVFKNGNIVPSEMENGLWLVTLWYKSVKKLKSTPGCMAYLKQGGPQ